jgi:transposase
VADGFHVIRIINHHCLNCWREIDPAASKNRGLVSLMRRHRHNLRPDQLLRSTAYLEKYPALELIYRFKQRLCYLLLKKHRTRRQCEILIPRFLRAVHQLRQAGLAQLVQLGHTLSAWSSEIVAMWRFTRNNGIASATFKTIDCASRYYVVNQFGLWVCPSCWRRASCFMVGAQGLEPRTSCV